MNFKIRIISLLILCLFTSITKAQRNDDNLSVKRDILKLNLREPNVQVKIKLIKISKIDKLIKVDYKLFDFDKHISLALQYLNSSNIDKSKDQLRTMIKIKYEKDGSISSSLKQYILKNTEYILNEDSELQKLPKDSLLVVTENYQSYSIVLEDIDDLRLIKKENIKSEIVKNLDKIKQRGLSYQRIITNETGIFKALEINERSGSNNFFSLNIVPALSVYKNKFIPSISPEIEYFTNLGMNTLSLSVAYESLIDFRNVNGKSTRTINGFLNFALRIKSNLKNKSNYSPGINIGFLIKRSGNMFEKNTFRIGLSQNIGKNIQLVPELYFPGKLNRITPGLKLKYSF